MLMTVLGYRFYYTNCTHFSASINPIADNGAQGFYVLHCEGPGLPLAGVHSVTTHKMVRVLYDTRLQRADKLSELALPTRQSFEVRTRLWKTFNHKDFSCIK